MNTEQISKSIFIYEDIYSNIDQRNPNEKCKIPIVFDDLMMLV